MDPTKMNLRKNINIAILGAVSAGKSTLTNTIFVNQFSDCHIKRTTALPQLYHELTLIESKRMESKDIEEDDHYLSSSDLDTIRANNRAKNKEIMDATASGESKLHLSDIKPVHYVVPKVKGFTNLATDDHGNDVVMTFWDMPGLNDSITKNVYHEYVRSIFDQFDIVIFMIDIQSALNTDGEVDILKLILSKISDNKKIGIETQLFIVTNKCDDINIDKYGIVTPSDEEFAEMYKQIKNIVTTNIKDCKLDNLNINYTCLSCEDAFIYRMTEAGLYSSLDDKYIFKIGANEFGKNKWKLMNNKDQRNAVKQLLNDTSTIKSGLKLSGWFEFCKIMDSMLTPPRQYMYVQNRFQQSLSIPQYGSKVDIINELKWFRTLHVNMIMTNMLFQKSNDTGCIKLAEKFNVFMIEQYNFIKVQIDAKSDDIQKYSILDKMKNNLVVFGDKLMKLIKVDTQPIKLLEDEMNRICITNLITVDSWDGVMIEFSRLCANNFPYIKQTVFRKCIDMCRDMLSFTATYYNDVIFIKYNLIKEGLLTVNSIPEYGMSTIEIITCLFESLRYTVDQICDKIDEIHQREMDVVETHLYAVDLIIWCDAATRAIGKYSCKWNNPQYTIFKTIKGALIITLNRFYEFRKNFVYINEMTPIAINNNMFYVVTDICDMAVNAYPDTFKRK